MKKLLAVVFLYILFCGNITAQWNGIPTQVTNPVTTSPTNDINSISVEDGSGGAVTAWTAPDDVTNNFYVFIQRKLVTGELSWGTVSAPLLLFTGSRYTAINDLVPDGSGGAYITWENELTDTTGDLYLQHVSNTGASLFTPGGIKVNTVANHYYSLGKLCSDATGVIITWSDQILHLNTDIPEYAQVFAQRYNATGVPQWGPGNVQVSTATGFRSLPEILADGANGAFISFVDSRNGVFDVNGNLDNGDIFAQHLNSVGSRLWGATDAVVSTAAYNQYILYGTVPTHSMISDQSGGFIIIYEDYRTNNDLSANLYAQRLNSAGTIAWPAGGVALSIPSPVYKNYVNIAADGAGGVVVSWDEYILGTGGDVHAQRMSAAGSLLWGNNGILVTPVTDFNFNSSTMAADGQGNYIVNWSGFDPLNFIGYIKGQKLNGSGIFQWAAGGADICTQATAYPRSPDIVRSISPTMLTTWEDFRNSSTDIYAARIGPTGNLISAADNYTTVSAGNWNNPATWAGNAVPPAGVDVVIKHNVTANVNSSCRSLSVQAPAVLTITNGIVINLSP